MAQAKPANPPQRKAPGAAVEIDLLTWWSAPLIAVILLIPVMIGRHYRSTAATIAVAAALLAVAPIVDRVQGKWRSRLGTIAAICLLYAVAILWPWGGWMALPPFALGIYATVEIGAGRGTNKRVAKKADAWLVEAIRKNAPPGTKVGRATETNGKVRVPLHFPAGTPEKATDNLASKVANGKVPSGKIKLVDLSDKKTAGSAEIVLSITRPFDFEMPSMPPVEEWPAGQFPLAKDEACRTVWMQFKTMDHVAVFGRTRWGKSNTLWVLLIGIIRSVRGVEFMMIDPKGGAELGMWRPWCSRFARTPQEGQALLAELNDRMDARYAQMEKAGQRKSNLFPIVCVIDEFAQMSNDAKSAAYVLRLAQMALAANIHLIVAAQYPTAELFGSALKQNISTVITHRLKDSTGSNVAVGQGAKGDGWDASKLEKPGRAIVEMPHLTEPRMMVQVFQAPDDIPDDLPAAPAPPAPHPTSEAPTQGEWAGVQGAGAGAGAPDPYLDPIEDGRPAKDKIRDLLSDMPRSAGWFGQTAGCARQVADRHLKTLANEGHARLREGQGWVRTKASLPVDDD